MNSQLILRSQTLHRRQPLLANDVGSAPPRTPSERKNVGEMAGGTAAECAAVCCCCPCAVMNLLLLALYRVPAGLFKKAMRKRKRQRLLRNIRKHEDVLLRQMSIDAETDMKLVTARLERMSKEPDGAAEKSESGELEREMWARFAGTGFWRSESQRQP